MRNTKSVFFAAAATVAVVCVPAAASAQRLASDHHATVAGRGGAVDYRGGDHAGIRYRPGPGLAAGALVGGAVAAVQPGYDGYGYGPGIYPGYAYGQAYPSVSYGYGLAPEDYLETCTYVGGPKSYNWTCR